MAHKHVPVVERIDIIPRGKSAKRKPASAMRAKVACKTRARTPRHVAEQVGNKASAADQVIAAIQGRTKYHVMTLQRCKAWST